MNRRTSLVAAALGVAVSGGAALGQIIPLGHGNGPAFETFHPSIPGTNIYEVIGGPFWFEPNAGPWIKNLIAPPQGWQPGQIYTLHETFTFFPPPDGTPGQPITDWHERIDFGFDGQIWDIWVGDPMFMVGSAPPPGLMTMVNDPRTELWFFFDPIEPGPNGVTFSIWKEFRYVGTFPMFDPVRIIQYPTPAPGAVALLALGGMVASRRRRG